MPFNLTPEEYSKLSEEEIKARKEALKAYKLQREINDSENKSFVRWLLNNAATLSLLAGILVSAGTIALNLQTLTSESEKTQSALQAQSTQITTQLGHLRVEVEKQNHEEQQDELKHFDELLRVASDAHAPTAQRVSLIWALEKYWTPKYELTLANALTSMIANDSDQAVMESCAEVIGHAYGQDTPEKDQERLRDMLYGDKYGNIGVVLRMENLIWERDNPTDSTAYLNKSLLDRARERIKDDKDHFKMRIFYITEAIRKNWENLQQVNLKKTVLPNIFLYRAHLEHANLKEAILIGARSFEAHFEDANLNQAHLEGANLEGAFFDRAVLTNAYLGPPAPDEVVHEPDQLNHTSLKGAHLKYAELKGACLRMADLTGAEIDNADLTDADLEGAIVSRKALEKTKSAIKGNPQYLP